MKRATGVMSTARMAKVVSIHALVKRATLQYHSHIKSPLSFNPRPREEGDRFVVFIILRLCVSIHALVKRATVFTKVRYNIDNVSIHALVKRAT